MKKNLLIASNNQADAKGTELAFQGIEDIRLLPCVYTGRDTIDTILARDVKRKYTDPGSFFTRFGRHLRFGLHWQT